MYQGLLYLHSLLRYFVFLMLVVVIVRSLIGWSKKSAFTKQDNTFSLLLLIFTHVQFLAGLLLYFVSPFVRFNHTTMKEATTRYWSVEHITMMIVAIALVTLARIRSKRMTTDGPKFKSLFIFNTVALIIILVAIVMSHRGLFGSVLFS